MNLNQPVLSRGAALGPDDVRSEKPLESQVASIWADTLKIECVDLDTDLRVLAGDERTQKVIFHSVADRFKLEPAVFLKASTIRGMCQIIRRHQNPETNAPPLQIPFAKTTGRVTEFSEGQFRFAVSQDAWTRWNWLAESTGAERADAALVILHALLYRYTGADQLTITLASRVGPGAESLLIAFNTHVGDEPSFRELLRRVVESRRITLELGDTWVVPGPRPVVFSFGECADLSFGPHDLGLRFHGEGQFGLLSYDAQRFDRHYIERAAGHFMALLDAAALEPDRPISRLAMLTEAEIRQIVFDWNNTGSYASDAMIHHGFEARANEQPDAVAVVANGKEFTFRQINERSNRLAHFLTAHGVRSGTFVGVCLNRSEEMVVAVLAVLKCGAAYVPLDAAYPKDRLAFMLQDAAAPVVLTQSALRQRLPGVECHYFCVDELRDELAKQSSENPAAQGRPDQLGYVIYTSGSTGRPKGVLMRHRPVVNVLDWVNTTFDVGASDRLLFVTSLSFDLSVYDIFGLLGAGGSIRVASEDELRDPNALLNIVRDEPITIWDSAPAALSQVTPFFALKRRDARENAGGGKLRLAMLSGDWIPVGLPDQIRSMFPAARVVSLGGATEAAIWSNWYPIAEVDPKWPSIPYGMPIRQARYHILDRYLQPLPVGVPGELHIGGAVLADGYLNRKELTEERFIPDPFAGRTEGARLYKTGDLARYMPDGNIEFLGRIDTQVKVRGFRVEAGEIESVILQFAGVRDAVVKPHKDAGGQNYLVVYVVAENGAAIDCRELNQHLHSKLPEYMVPSQIVVLESLPLTPNGKVDRGALRPPEGAIETRPYEAPADEIEATVAQLWAEALGLAQVGRQDNFFELGGHSLRAAQVVARLLDMFDVELHLRKLFEKPTVAAFAEDLRDAIRSGASARIARKRGTTRAAGSLIQQRFWFLDRNIADRTIYNVSDAIRIQGELNVNALRKAWQAVVDRQDSLRTTFENVDGWPEQIIQPQSIVTLPIIDLSARADAEAECRRLQAEDARQTFDVVNGPLWRARLMKLGPTEHVLNWTIHHIVVDESSRAVLLKDLWSAYEAAATGKSATRPELDVRYLDYSLWQRERLTTLAIEFWKQKLKAAPPPIVPPHPKTRPASRSYQGANIPFVIPPALADAMGKIGRQAGVTPYVVWLAAFQTLLSRYTGQTDICIGSPVTARPSAARDIVGCFINTLVLRTDLSGDPGFKELLDRARSTVAEGIQHSEVPFEKLVEELRPERIPGGHPLFQSLFVYQAEDLRGRVQRLTWQHDHMERVGAKFDFTLTIEQQGDRTTGYIEYAADLYDADTVQRYIGHFLTLIEAIAANPHRNLSTLPLLPCFEQKRVLEDFNKTGGVYPSAQCVHQLVEEQAARTPDAVAFEFKGKPLTFRELNERANQLAHQLRLEGVGPDTLVGLCVERSLDMPVAMLGILKSGGAYVPLDPDFPPDRLSFYISDSRMPIIVAHQHLLDNLPVGGVRQVCLDGHADKLAHQPVANPPVTARPDSMIYVLYTSGSTGRPNGVAIEHRSLVNLLWSFKNSPGLSSDDTILSITTLSFDIHTVETWLPMIVGARSIIVPRETALDGHRLIELIETCQATAMQSTPATWRLLLTAGWKGKPNLKVMVGGEALSAELSEQLLERAGEVWNVYGPTETTVWSIIHKLSRQDDRILIGKPILNTQVYVLDPVSRQPMPIGCVGEIWIAGAGLARGYLGREELTTTRFVPNPFTADRDARMYKTGDLGRFLPDGSLECLGRVDHQVKVRGFRIELNEIERVLEDHEQLAQVVVVARTDDEFSAMLHAYYRCQPGQAPIPADLRQFAQGRLPDYMIPATFTRLQEFPQTPNGKVDRKALPAPTAESSVRSVERERILPSNDAERALLEIWEEVLGIRPISVLDDFHELGGHSLLAAVLMSRIESRLGHRIPLEVLFEKPNVRGLADVITRKLELGIGSMVPLQTGGSQPPLFLIAGVGGHVFAFHRFARLLGPDFTVYGMKAIGVDGSEPPLERFEAIAARYVKEILKECPHGPYIVGGYSVGGRIAMEVALQLQALGKSVPRLIVFDMFAPGYPKPLPLLRRVAVHCKRLLKLPRPEKWQYARRRMSRILGRVNVEVFQDIAVKDLDVVPQQILTDVGNALLRGNEAYMPVRKYKGRVVLVQSDVIEEWEEAVEKVPFQGWVPWSTEPVEEYTIRAAHLEIFKDHVQPRLAEIVRDVIQSTSDEPADSVLTG